MSAPGGQKPTVVFGARPWSKRGGESQRPKGSTKWSWVEPRVWTKRMLAALEAGVKGDKWYSLIDKLHPEDTLRAAFAQVEANQGAAGVDHFTIAQFACDLDANLSV
jgi:hypothetical protein